jgi:hypothetical protein
MVKSIPTFPASTPGYTFANHFNPIVAGGSVTYTFDRFPLYRGALPVKFAGEYMNNPAAARNNEGWWAGVTLGKSGKKGLWDISYRYQRLEANAWWDQIVDDDNIAVFPDASGGIPLRISPPAAPISKVIWSSSTIRSLIRSQPAPFT